MSSALPPVRPITLDDVEGARERIRGTVLRTPLVRLDLGPGGPDVRLKLENLQPTNSYKLRGAVNAVASLDPEARARGVWTISAGNAGQGVAYAARAAGVPCSVVVIDTAPATKMERMRALGATLVPVPFDAAWTALQEHAFPGLEGTLIHPFDDHDFIAGHATLGLEILEDAPDVAAVLCGIGGGGLITAVGSAVKARRPDVQVLGVEPETAAPMAASLAAGAPQVFEGWTKSFVDGAGGKSVMPRMWERMRPVTDGSRVVGLADVRAAVRLMAEKTRVVSEGAGALGLAAVLSGQAGPAADGPVVAVVSGGNIDMETFRDILAG